MLLCFYADDDIYEHIQNIEPTYTAIRAGLTTLTGTSPGKRGGGTSNPEHLPHSVELTVRDVVRLGSGGPLVFDDRARAQRDRISGELSAERKPVEDADQEQHHVHQPRFFLRVPTQQHGSNNMDANKLAS